MVDKSLLWLLNGTDDKIAEEKVEDADTYESKVADNIQKLMQNFENTELVTKVDESASKVKGIRTKILKM